MKTVSAFSDLVGKEFNFYGVDNCCFKLGNDVWEAIEDESDGYRSYLDTIRSADKTSHIFNRTPIARVKVVSRDTDLRSFDGYSLIDTKDGHEWLLVGTDNSDDYYPCFTFNYAAKPPKGK